ncbi:hypothetical protein SRHO_G00036020 [Serrasalmus rhombeus]
MFLSSEASLSAWPAGTRLGRDHSGDWILSSLTEPGPIAIEPCSGSHAAVLTVLVNLPRENSGVPPPGQSGKIPQDPLEAWWSYSQNA